MAVDKLKPRVKLWLNSEDVDGVFGDGKCRLLKSIEATGSLRAASELLHISYRKAWGDLKKAQNALGVALIDQHRGGARRPDCAHRAGKALAPGVQSLSPGCRDCGAGVLREICRRGWVDRRSVTDTCSRRRPAGRVGLAPPSSRRRGFSLIELLVVISIVALLMALAMPALARARSLARQTVCQSRLRQWGLAFAAYAAENSGFYPHADGRDRCGDEEPFTREGIADYWFGWVDVVAPSDGRDAVARARPRRSIPASSRCSNAPRLNWPPNRCIRTSRCGTGSSPMR